MGVLYNSFILPNCVEQYREPYRKPRSISLYGVHRRKLCTR